MNYIPIAHLQLGQICDQIFLVNQTTKFPNFIEFELIDVTGKVRAVYWNQLPPELLNGKFVEIKGYVQQYKDKKQIKIQRINLYNGTPLNLTDYISGPNESILQHYCVLLNDIVSQMDDPHYRDLINYAINKLGIIEMLKNSPFGLEGPMANKGGLLLHTIHHLQTILSTLQNFTTNNDLKLNKSLIIAGCIFRHLGWATTTCIKGHSVEPLDSFYTISPQMSAFRLIDHVCLGAESDLQTGIPEPCKQALSNCIQDQPTTLEGQLLVLADRLTYAMERGQQTLLRSQNKNWIDNYFVGHLT